MGLVATSFSGFLVYNLRTHYHIEISFAPICQIFPESVSIPFRTSILTVKYFLAVLFSFDFHLPCLLSLSITIIWVMY